MSTSKPKSAKKSRGSRKKKAAGDDKEFWEAWADEKQGRDSDEGEAAQDSEGDAAGDDGATSVRLYVNIGKREEISAEDVRDLLAEGLEADAAERIGKVALRNTHSYVRVPEDLVDTVISSAEGKSYKDRDVVVERARR